VELAVRKSRASLSLPGGVALSREAFDAALIGAAIQSGVSFLPGTFGTLGEDAGSARCVMLRQGQQRQEVFTRLVLAAVGLGGLGRTGERNPPAPWNPGPRMGAGAVADQPPAFSRAGTIYMACAPGGYLGLVRREDGRLNVAAALDGALVQRSGGPGRAA